MQAILVGPGCVGKRRNYENPGVHLNSKWMCTSIYSLKGGAFSCAGSAATIINLVCAVPERFEAVAGLRQLKLKPEKEHLHNGTCLLVDGTLDYGQNGENIGDILVSIAIS
jgi:hypothetical protein